MSYYWLTMQKIGFFILSIFLLASCVPESSALKIAFKDKKKSAPMSVSSVQIVNNQLVINGVNLNEATDVSISGNSLSENFTIESKNATQMIANARHGFSFDISKAFSLLISNAEASATFAIDFSLCNATLNNAGFNCSIAAQDNDVLSYDQATDKWVPRSLNGLSYQGTWDAANDPLPTTAGVGNYFIVSSVNAPYGVGDWIVWNGTTYDRVAMPTAVTSVFGRSGVVVATEGDYTLDQLLDVDLTVAPVNGKVLKYNGTKWVAADDVAGGAGGAGSVASSEIADGSIMNADINASAAIDYSKLNIPAGAIPYAKLSIANGDIPYAKLTVGNGDIPYAKLNIADGDIPAAKITGLPAALPSGGTTLQYFAGDKTLQTLNTDVVPETTTNYYFTDARVRAATLTGLTSNSGTIGAGDTVFGAFRKLLGTQGDYVSKSANTTVLGSITIDNTVGELHVPTLPTSGADLTQAASVGYVQNFLGTVGQWIKTATDIGYTAGNVGIGVAVPGAKLHVMNGATAFEKTSVDTSGPTFSFWKHRNYAATVSGDELGFISFFGHDGTGLARSAFILGKTDGAPAAGSVPGSLGFYTTTAGSADSTEKMHISENGNVGIGTTSPDNKLEVAGDMAADSLLVRGEIGTFGWNNDVYNSTSAILGLPGGAGVRVTNANDMDGALGFFTGASRNTAGTTQAFYIGSVSNNTGYAPTIVFGQQTGATAYDERMRISASGNVGIGTISAEAKLTVAGAIVSTPPAPYAGATVNLATSNTQVLTNVGQAAITLTNMVHGGSYTLIVQDAVSRTYTFTGCTTSKFQPANMPTIAATHTMYNIMTVYNGTNYDCYITWSSGYN